MENLRKKNLTTLFPRILSVLFILSALSCAHTSSEQKKKLVLISGSHLDESSWNEVIKNLNSSTYSVTALPRLGRDPEHPTHLKQTAEAACQRIENSSTLVAHSFGGVLANEIVGVCPTKISKIIYVAALVPFSGEHGTDLLKGADQKSYMSAVKIEKDRISPKSKNSFLLTLDSGIDVDQKSLPGVYPESLLGSADTLQLNQDDLENVQKYYVFTSEDKIISPDYQKKIAGRVHLAATNTIRSGHLPMISKPQELSRIIQSFVNDSSQN